jgi:hypothetical protein
MPETITMTMTDQRRVWVLTKLLSDELTVHEVAMFSCCAGRLTTPPASRADGRGGVGRRGT